MIGDIDQHLGNRVRRRRRLMGLTQHQLAEMVGVRFQQVQKYECGANRMSAARMWYLSKALEVPVAYFYDGLSDGAEPSSSVAHAPVDEGRDMFAQKETLDLIKAYYDLGERPRRRLLDLAKSLNGDLEPL